MLRGILLRDLVVVLIALQVGALALVSPASAGGLLLTEVGTEEVALAGAGWSARAQDAATVLTNPAGMTHLSGTQILVGMQALYGDTPFKVYPGTSPGLGDKGGNPIGWFPGGGIFLTHRVSPKVALGLAVTGNFGLSEEYEQGWAGRYYVEKATLLGISVLPAVAYQVSESVSLGAALNAVHGSQEIRVAVNNITGADGQLELEDTTWGYGVNLGLNYDGGDGTRLGLTYTSQVVQAYSAPTNFSGLSSGVEAILRARGLLDANVDLGLRIPQTFMLSAFHELGPNSALLANVGWQQWSRFGRVDVGVDSSDPVSLTTESTFKDTWHGALGFQHKLSEPWRLACGIAYDSGFQEDGNISPALPANAAWRFGLGLRSPVRNTFGWGFGVEYAYGGTMEVTKESDAPVAVGGRGDLVGAFENSGIFFISANLEWRF